MGNLPHDTHLMESWYLGGLWCCNCGPGLYRAVQMNKSGSIECTHPEEIARTRVGLCAEIAHTRYP